MEIIGQRVAYARAITISPRGHSTSLGKILSMTNFQEKLRTDERTDERPVLCQGVQTTPYNIYSSLKQIMS